MFVVAAIGFMLAPSPDFAPSPDDFEPASMGTGNPAHDVLTQLSEVDVNRRLARLLANEPCDGVDKSYYQGMDSQKVAFWNARCSSGRSYAITLKPDGSSRTLDCVSLLAVAKVECFQSLPGATQ